MVTPELAAQIIKHFVLPMFDTDTRKNLRIKTANRGSVIGELKLTETLYS